MRRSTSPPPPPPLSSTDRSASAARGDWHTVRILLPYLLAYKGRVAVALSCLIAAKVANVGVPLILKQVVDSLTPGSQGQILVLPLVLLVAYGVLRLSTTAFTELREFFFAKVTQRAVRTIALKTFRHLHELSLRFHLARQTGGLTRDVERGTRGISTLIGFTLFSILPTLIEIALVSAILVARYDLWFIGITLAALVLHRLPVTITEWRTGATADERNDSGATPSDRQPAQLQIINISTTRIRGPRAARRVCGDGKRRCRVRPSLSLLNIEGNASCRCCNADHGGRLGRWSGHDDHRRHGADKRLY
jgi:ABC-type multidrug transport system fused ATPase/permease subunit